jgi:phytoene dehydrogenase-like protein
VLYSKRDKITKDYDVIVVGAGLAGMTAANRLARMGRSVLLLEAHNKLGGFATWFKRAKGDHIFDISLHGFPSGMLKTCKKYWGKEIADKIGRVSKVRYVNPQFQVETDFTKEHFTELLIKKFEIAPEKAQAFFDELANMNFYDAPEMTNGQLFEKWFPNRPDVVRFLLEPIVYANGSNLEDPAISYGIVFSNFMGQGVHIFRGGTDMMIGLMKEELLRNNVDIRLHAKIDKVVFEKLPSGKSRAKGVMLDGELIQAGAVLSNSSLYNTVFSLAGAEHLPEEFKKKAEAVRPNTSSCQVFMGIKAGEHLPDVGELIFYSEDNEFSTERLLATDSKSQTFSLYYPETRPHLGERYAVVSSFNARFEDWADLSEEDYETRKKEMQERAVAGLEKIIPGVREKIDFIESSTPKTIVGYTHHYRGSSFGTKFEGLDVSMNLHKEVDGLFHAGSVGIIMSGWLGAANYGVIQSHAVDTYLDLLTSERA